MENVNVGIDILTLTI